METPKTVRTSTRRRSKTAEATMGDAGAAPARLTSVQRFATDEGLALTRFAYLICGDRHRAEDLVQDVLLAMHRRFGPSITADDPMAYARRAIVNANVSWSRRHWSRDLLVDEPPDVGVHDPDRIVDDELWLSLATLPPRQRAVLVMRYYAGYSDVDIADALSCRRATVRSLAARALADLRRGLGPTAPAPSRPDPEGGAS